MGFSVSPEEFEGGDVEEIEGVDKVSVLFLLGLGVAEMPGRRRLQGLGKNLSGLGCGRCGAGFWSGGGCAGFGGRGATPWEGGGGDTGRQGRTSGEELSTSEGELAKIHLRKLN